MWLKYILAFTGGNYDFRSAVLNNMNGLVNVWSSNRTNVMYARRLQTNSTILYLSAVGDPSYGFLVRKSPSPHHLSGSYGLAEEGISDKIVAPGSAPIGDIAAGTWTFNYGGTLVVRNTITQWTLKKPRTGDNTYALLLGGTYAAHSTGILSGYEKVSVRRKIPSLIFSPEAMGWPREII